VHPAHVPFHAESQAAEPCRPGYLGPGSRLFRNHQGAWKLFVRDGVQVTQKIDSFQVFSATVFIWNPVTGFARVIQVEHGGDGIHPQAIQMKLLKPVDGAGEQEIAYLFTPVIEDQCSPVPVFSLARVFVLVKGAAVKTCQCMTVFGEMGWNPIKENTDSPLVQIVNEIAEVVSVAETTGGRKVPSGLITP